MTQCCEKGSCEGVAKSGCGGPCPNISLNDGRNTEEVLILIAFDRSMSRAFCNSVIREKNVIRNYGNGHLVGYAEQLSCVQGTWPEKLTIGLLNFNSVKEANRWFISDPIFRQQDWLDNVDMHMIPLSKPYPADYSFIEIQNLDVVFKEAFLECYKPRYTNSVEQYGAVPRVAATSGVERLRGRRNLDYVIITVWPCEDAYNAWSSSDECQHLKELRDQTSMGDVLVGTLKIKV